MDLAKMINDQVKELDQSGEINNIVAAHAKKAIEDIVSDMFRYNGEAKQAIREAIGEKMEISQNISLANYSKIVSNVVESEINQFSDDLRNGIKDSIQKASGIIDKKSWKLSEIIEKFIDFIDKDDMDDESSKISLIVEQDDDFCHVYFDAEPERKMRH